MVASDDPLGDDAPSDDVSDLTVELSSVLATVDSLEIVPLVELSGKLFICLVVTSILSDDATFALVVVVLLV